MHKFFLMLFAALTLTACGVDGVDTLDTESALRGNGNNANGQFCGGIAGIQCPDGYECKDDRSDNCDPVINADCAGVCKRAGGPKDRCDHQPSEYVGNSEECTRITFVCEEGYQYFSDDCGCGCEPIPEPTGEACGTETCADGMVCCNASCGICTAPGEFCIQIACEPETM